MFRSARRAVLPGHSLTASRLLAVGLLAAAAAAAGGCASPLYRARPELTAGKDAIRRMGVLPPAIAMYQEQVRARLVPKDDWSREVTATFRKAFVEEMASGGIPVAALPGDDPELGAMADLFGAVDHGIARHVYGDFEEAFPAKARSFDYSLGPARETMERHGVDAIWIVTGRNYVPTTAEKLMDALEFVLAVAGGAGGAPAAPTSLMKVDLRAALVDRDGTILFYCRLTRPDILGFEWNPGVPGGAAGAGDAGPASGEATDEDLRDPRYARRCVKALVAEYRKAARR